MADLAAAARAALAEGAAALVTVLATEGSAPRGPGARMLVTGGGSSGTIGGGALELRAIEQARRVLTLPPGSWRAQDYPLGPLLGQCCGGRVRLLVERLAEAEWLAAVVGGERVVTVLGEGTISRLPAGLVRATSAGGEHDTSVRQPGLVPGSTVDEQNRVAGEGPRWMPEHLRHDGGGSVPARGPLPAAGTEFVEPVERPGRPLLLFGAGHVGRAVAAAAAPLPLRLAWFDVRAEAEAPGVMLADADALPGCAADAAAEAAVLVMTHDHDLDYRIVAGALRGRAGFVGLIGSATKRARFLARLERDGCDAATRARLTCPIGVPGIAGKEPAVIAASAVAQLLALGRVAA